MDGQDFREWTVREAGPCAFSWAVLREPYQWVGGPPVRPYPRAFPLSKGPHTCVIKGAEPGTRLDRIAIANYPFPPE
jgi:hypothetical protein